jgi:3-oxoadipate enol-lactonase
MRLSRFGDLVTGTDLWWSSEGAGSPVVLLHNGLMDARMWDDVVPRLSTDHRVIRCDLRFFGRSARTPGRFSERDDLAAVLDAARAPPAALVGNSLGGRIALDFALERPERVSALVLAAAPVGGLPLEGVYPPEVEAAAEAALEAGEFERVMELALEQWATLGVTPQMRELALANAHTEALGEESEPLELTPPAAERLDQLTTPTLVLSCGHDLAPIREMADLVERAAPGARRVHWDDADHFPSMRHPDRFAELVGEFLRARRR